MEGKVTAPGKILGVYGGLGPAASADFLRVLAHMAPARVDQDHPVVYMYSNPQIPDRSSAIMGQGPSPEEDLKSGLMTLCSWGAGILAVPCNTAHFFIDRFRDELPVPLVHIVEATVEEAIVASPVGAWLIATGGTVHSGIYQKEVQKRGYDLFEPSEAVMDKVRRSIVAVKVGELPLSGELMKQVVDELRSLRDLPVVGACTELPLAYQASGLPQEGMISSLDALARKSLSALYGPKMDIV